MFDTSSRYGQQTNVINPETQEALDPLLDKGEATEVHRQSVAKEAQEYPQSMKLTIALEQLEQRAVQNFDTSDFDSAIATKGVFSKPYSEMKKKLEEHDQKLAQATSGESTAEPEAARTVLEGQRSELVIQMTYYLVLLLNKKQEAMVFELKDNLTRLKNGENAEKIKALAAFKEQVNALATFAIMFDVVVEQTVHLIGLYLKQHAKDVFDPNNFMAQLNNDFGVELSVSQFYRPGANDGNPALFLEQEYATLSQSKRAQAIFDAIERLLHRFNHEEVPATQAEHGIEQAVNSAEGEVALDQPTADVINEIDAIAPSDSESQQQDQDQPDPTHY